MAEARGRWWSWFEPSDPGADVPEWLLDVHADFVTESRDARPYFLFKTDRNLKAWPDQRWIKNERYYRTYNEDGRMVQMQAQDETLVISNEGWRTAFPHVLQTDEEEVRIKMVEPRRMSFLGGVLTLTGDKWRTEGDPMPTGFDGDYMDRDVIVVAPKFGVEPEGYARVGFVNIDDMENSESIHRRSHLRSAKVRREYPKWMEMESTPDLCLDHNLIAQAVAKLQPSLRCAIVSSSFGKKLEPVDRNGVPKGMCADQEIVVTSPRESQLQTEQPGAGFLA